MEYIEKLYQENMWFTERHKEYLERHVKEDGWDEQKVREAVAAAGDGAKKDFLMVFDRMGSKDKYYRVVKSIFKINEQSEIEIACKYVFQKLVGSYRVVISPVYNYDYHACERFEPFSLLVQAHDNRIVIPYVFDHEDLYNVNVFYLLDEKEHLLLSTKVYALADDLYGKGMYKADFHVHTTHSDGYEPPELVAVSARKRGMDIIAVTDHNHFEGSVVTREKVRELGLDMTVILGEEYSLDYSPMHILALGTEKPIERRFLTRQALEMEETAEILKNCPELSCDPEAYACTQVLLDEVKKLDGISILAHPYWKPIIPSGHRMDTPENLFIELGKDRRFSGIELVSGSKEGEYNVSNLQTLLAREILGGFEHLPVIGITDSHCYTTDPICGKHFTVVIADDKEEKSILKALKEGTCVAVEMAGAVPICYGTHRLVKLAEFLVGYYFPQRDAAARQEADGMLEREL